MNNSPLTPSSGELDELEQILAEYGEYWHLAELNKFGAAQMAVEFPDETNLRQAVERLEALIATAVTAAEQEAYKKGYVDGSLAGDK